MKILLVNYRYFISGGPERYMFNVIEEFTNRGHETIPFSIKYTKNIPTEYDRYFVDPLGSKDEILFRDQKMTPKSIYRTARRLFYDPEVERAVDKLISDTKPQIAYALNFMKKMSPAVMVGIKNRGLPLVVRISDYGFVCPGIHCIRDDKPCDLCVSGNILPSIKYRCVQNSFTASSLYALARQYHRSKKFFDLIDQFVVTNDFMYKMMVRAGYSESRLKVIPTLVKTEIIKGKIINNPPLIVFVGRLERIKGVHVLLSALHLLRENYPSLEFIVKIAGSGDTHYVNELNSFLISNNLENRVNFLGELNYSQISTLFQNALISIIPSVMYENLPNSLLESFTFGVPVIGSNIGSLSGVIKDQQNGLLFEPGSENDLADKIKYSLENPNIVMKWGENAKILAENEFSPEKHLNKLTTLFEELITP
jgi:glycosyltransferase involved in cell wall biosynthesis